MSSAITQTVRIVMIAQFAAMATAQMQLAKRDKHTLGLAFGLSAGVGAAGMLALILIIYCLRQRRKRRRAAGLEPEEEMGDWCTCKDCSGCKRKRGGGDGSQSCWKCRQGCAT
ncbi:uncharacterized protein K460DRAFT_37676 [Cucurbitaria berberidis CBS 394.84]|uniref:Transmembrane protein n=1 Tax=Cucurbitaria berberidis CBS 394.84 TaxID=1168544 RepID=A0A9P4LEQ0_9PLEO|nr:uncharacterized protein K460DRAFT_37676 [Cucurbitaria berberidis CBS 394.84]KAF1851587.1 hypothetical protein K460DRAFT_37676 [Cucurbitaria berberidis CBS 394.84]